MSTRTLTEEYINTVYAALAAARIGLADAFEMNRQARWALEDAKAHILTTTDPKQLGSNETIRTAVIDAMLNREVMAVRETEAKEYAARLTYDLAQIDVKSVETLIAWFAVRPTDAR